MYVSIVNKEICYLVSSCLTSAPRPETRSGVRGRSRAQGAAGEGIIPRETTLEDALGPRSGHWGLLWLARVARLSSPSRELPLQKAAPLEPSPANPALTRRCRPTKTSVKALAASDLATAPSVWSEPSCSAEERGAEKASSKEACPRIYKVHGFYRHLRSKLVISS
jgi:hypothetical protein